MGSTQECIYHIYIILSLLKIRSPFSFSFAISKSSWLGKTDKWQQVLSCQQNYSFETGFSHLWGKKPLIFIITPSKATWEREIVAWAFTHCLIETHKTNECMYPANYFVKCTDKNGMALCMGFLTTCCTFCATERNSLDSFCRYSGRNSMLATRNSPTKYKASLFSASTVKQNGQIWVYAIFLSLSTWK